MKAVIFKHTGILIASGVALFGILCLLEWYILIPSPLDNAIQAIKNDDLHKLESTLSEIDVNSRISDPNPMISGETLLMHATRQVNHAMVKMLLRKGAEPSLQRGDGSAAIHFAVRSSPCSTAKKQEAFRILETLVAYHETVNLSSPLVNTPLCLAALLRTNDRYEKVKLLLHHGASAAIRVRCDNRDILEWIKEDQVMVEIFERARRREQDEGKRTGPIERPAK